jgi:hypothetical protein
MVSPLGASANSGPIITVPDNVDNGKLLINW